jgi:protein-S-isoprenylcysteine O-methyltransferase Ste14
MSSTPLSAEDIQGHRTRVGWTTLAVAALIAVAWAVALFWDRQALISTPNLLGYLISDVLLVIPLCIASWIGFIRGQAWGGLVFLVTVGSLAFQVLHLGVFLISQELFPLPLPIYGGMAVLLLGLALLANWEAAVLLNVDSFIFRLTWDQFRYVIVITLVLHSVFILFAPAVYAVPEFFIVIMMANLLLIADIYVRPVYKGEDQEPWWYKFLGLGLAAVFFLLPYFEVTIVAWPIPRWVSWIAIAGGLLSGGVAIYCRIIMRDYALGTLTIIDGHRLFKDNLYHYVRHPIYTSFMLAGFFYGLTFRAPVSAVVTFLASFFFFNERIRREDRMLEDHFGDEFREYKSSTPPFFPNLLALLAPSKAEPRVEDDR